jgi:hypothetical protein
MSMVFFNFFLSDLDVFDMSKKIEKLKTLMTETNSLNPQTYFHREFLVIR